MKTFKKREVIEALNELENVAHSAVGNVGHYNAPDQIEQAHKSIEDACNKIVENLGKKK